MSQPPEPADGVRPVWQPDFAPASDPVVPTSAPQGTPGYGAPDAAYPGPVLQPCYRHAARPTGIGCQRCGRPICPECMVEAPVGYQCPECVAQGRRATRQDRVLRAARGGGRITTGLVAVNVVLWLATLATGGNGSPLLTSLALNPTGSCERDGDLFVGGTAAACAAFGGTWAPGVAEGAVWQVVTSAFMHASPLHIAFNMFALWVLGPQLERLLGAARYLALYGVSALAGSTMVMWFSDPTTTTLGASGALFGLMGALLVIAIRFGGDVRNILFWLGANLLFTVSLAGQISWQGHVGGLLGGLAASALLVDARRGPTPRIRWVALGGVVVALCVAIAVRIVQLA